MKPSALLPWVLALCAPFGLGCVSGNKVRADSEVIRSDIERARRSGAYRCAPRELATAEANLDFALGELSEGSSLRAHEHIRDAESAAKKALALSRECAPKTVLVQARPVEKPVVVQVEATDRDGDGVLDKDDACVDVPEDRDGFQDEDGCPDLDNDQDKIPDLSDRCPDTPGAPENQGCPREDSDGDGIPDDADRCRDQPEDKDGFQDEDGCPELDNDNDGLMDTADKCPLEAGPPVNMGCPIVDKDGDGINDGADQCIEEPEDKDGFQDEDGCPDLDNDGDTVVDRLDECPEVHGVPEEKGCPRQYKMVVVKKDRIEIKQQIKFSTGSHKIIGKNSFAILDDISRALADNANIKHIRIEGHTDAVGDDSSNLRLSQRRAEAVLSELLKRRIDPARMQAVGFGETKPISSNSSKTGRAENRRTEFNIVDQ